jgi:hypothetical protein
VCSLCLETGKHKEISVTDGNTSGLKAHLRNKHLTKFDELVVEEAEKKEKKKKVAPSNVVTSYYKAKLDTNVTKLLYTRAAAACIIDNCLPLSIAESKSFRTMFLPLNKDALKIVNINKNAIKEQIITLGRMVERATQIEMSGRVMAWTTDHWTGPNGLTYGAVTAHYINKKWELVSVLILTSKYLKGGQLELSFLMISHPF